MHRRIWYDKSIRPVNQVHKTEHLVLSPFPFADMTFHKYLGIEFEFFLLLILKISHIDVHVDDKY